MINTSPILVALLTTGIAFWYFNIRSCSKCIVLHPKCDSIKCTIYPNQELNTD
jgi:hypothetical protein